MNNPLVGFDSSLRPYPMSPPRTSRPKAPLLGFLSPLQRIQEEKVHVSPVARSSSPVLPGICLQVPPCRLRCRSQVFSTSQRRSSSPPRPAIFRQVTLVGFGPTGSCSFREAPDARRRRCALMTFFPWFALSPFLGGDNLGRIDRLPRIARPVPFFVFRAFVFVEVDLRH